MDERQDLFDTLESLHVPDDQPDFDGWNDWGSDEEYDVEPSQPYEKLTFDSMCVGGAGVRGIYELGALHTFYSSPRVDMTKIRTFIGTSIGAVIVLLMSIGYTPMEIFHYVTKIDKWIDFKSIDVLGFNKDFGLFDIRVLIDHAKFLIEKKFRYVPTLRQLYELTGKRFVATVVNVTKGRVEYVDHESYPELPCILGLSMTCAIPLIFKRIKYGSCYYVDGGLLENLPIRALDENSKALIVCVAENFSPKSTETTIGYLHALTSLPILQNQKMTIASMKPEEHGHTLATIALTEAPISIDFNIDKTKRYEMFQVGCDAASEVIERKTQK